MKTVKELIGAGLKYIGKVWTLIIFYTWLCLESVRSVSFELLMMFVIKLFFEFSAQTKL